MDVTRMIVNKKGIQKSYVIDKEFEEYHDKFQWHLHPINYGRQYYVCRSGNKKIDHKTTVPLHQEVVKFYGMDIPKGMVIDHISRNQFNNKISNLRVVTVRENNLNKHRSVVNRGHLFGWNYSHDKYGWQVQVSILGVTKYQGRVRTEIEALEWCRSGIRPGVRL